VGGGQSLPNRREKGEEAGAQAGQPVIRGSSLVGRGHAPVADSTGMAARQPVNLRADRETPKVQVVRDLADGVPRGSCCAAEGGQGKADHPGQGLSCTPPPACGRGRTGERRRQGPGRVAAEAGDPRAPQEAQAHQSAGEEEPPGARPPPRPLRRQSRGIELGRRLSRRSDAMRKTTMAARKGEVSPEPFKEWLQSSFYWDAMTCRRPET
jgi:hypothetical protein